MKAISKDYMKKAHRLLDEMDQMIEVGLYEAAGRNAYLSGLHAANAVIFESSEIVVNKHKNAHQALSKTLHARGVNDRWLTSFLPLTMQLKEIADYETGGDGITKDVAEKAYEDVALFIKKMEAIIRGMPAAKTKKKSSP